MTRSSAFALLLCFAVTPALAQVSAQVRAGNLSGSAQAGVTAGADTDRDRDDRQVARGPRTDDTRDCDTRGVTVRSGNGSSSASASVSTSPGGSSVVAGGGSPGSQTEYFGCEARNHDNDRRTR